MVTDSTSKMVKFFKNKFVMPILYQKDDLLIRTKKNTEFENLLYTLKKELRKLKKTKFWFKNLVHNS